MIKSFQLFLLAFCLSLFGCSNYSLSNLNIGNAKTIQVDIISNQASLIEPKLSQLFTEELRNKIVRQTNLSLVSSRGDLRYSGEIIDYRIQPMGATSSQTASQNRLTVVVNIRFVNVLDDNGNFEKQFSFYSDFDANQQLTGEVLDQSLSQINERIIQDILNSSLSNW